MSVADARSISSQQVREGHEHRVGFDPDQAFAEQAVGIINGGFLLLKLSVGSRLDRRFRDTQRVRHQGLVSDSRLKTAGQLYLGVEPEFPFVAL